MQRIIDLSHTIKSDMPVYPGDDAAELVQTRYLEQHFHNNHRLQIGMHVGTHLDAPLHMLAGGQDITQLPLTAFIGPACVLDVRNQPVISWQESYEHLLPVGGIVLLYTGHDRWYGSDRYFEEHPVLDPVFCDFLLAKQTKLLGLDSPSPDRPPFPVHKRLLASGIYLLENLTNLGKLLDWPDFEVIALPLKLKADGSPARVVARIT